MGCGTSKADAREPTPLPTANPARHKTPSMSSSSSGISSADHTPSPAYLRHSVTSLERRQQQERERQRQQEIERYQLERHQRRASDPGKSDAAFVTQNVSLAPLESEQAEDDDQQDVARTSQPQEHQDDAADTEQQEVIESTQQQVNTDPTEPDNQPEEDADPTQDDDQQLNSTDPTETDQRLQEDDSTTLTVIPAQTVDIQTGEEHTETKEQTQGTQPARIFTPLEVQQHNNEVGWVEWIPHKRKVYDGNGFKSHFPAYLQKREETAGQQREVEDGEEEEGEGEKKTFFNPFLAYHMLPPIESDEAWKMNGVTVLRCRGLYEEEIEREIAPFLLGVLKDNTDTEYWDSVRKDVAQLVQDIQSTDELKRTPAEEDHLRKLTRWQEKYQHVDPQGLQEPPAAGDPNEAQFQIPVDPESLQVWLLDWQAFDTELPEEGAWTPLELEEVDLGDPHEVFAETLRVDRNDLNLGSEFTFDIDGDAAWEVLPDDVVEKDEMTPDQEKTHAAREKRTDMDDPERMRRRREKLAEHFIQVREIPADIVTPFLQWAELMEKNKEQLEKLCEE